MTRLERIAVRLLQAEKPLPVDLIARLLEQGVDVSELERRYGA